MNGEREHPADASPRPRRLARRVGTAGAWLALGFGIALAALLALPACSATER